jgi:predicted O-methyltransferase YrrM
MSSRTLQLSDELHAYLLREMAPEDALLRRLRDETARLPNAGMQISPEQGQFMRLLVELIGGRRALEIGTYTGYSALCVGRALPADGKLICCDTSREWTDVARRYWQEAGLAERIDLRLGPALRTIDTLLSQGGAGTFDFAFIDADKTHYDDYYEHALELLRPGGVAAVDNALWGGRVVDPATTDADTRAIAALNRKAARDARVTASLVPIGDGLLLARKR